MKRLSYSILLFVVLFPGLQGQNALEQYIQQGLASNLALQQKEFSFEKSLQALREAKGMFLPTIGVEARYSAAGGGDAPSISPWET